MSNRELDTYIYIDVSNIRGACSRSLEFSIDFVKLLQYFKSRYPKLKEVRYYEGVAKDNTQKEAYFRMLKREGYQVCTLERKNYVSPAIYKEFYCKKCHARNSVRICPPMVKMKSNVDVYLSSDMLYRAALRRKAIHIVLVACDGDYKEAIDNILRINPYAMVTILATPYTPRNNCLSKRLQVFNSQASTRTKLLDISHIKDHISVDVNP